jgi:hypothetical protein
MSSAVLGPSSFVSKRRVFGGVEKKLLFFNFLMGGKKKCQVLGGFPPKMVLNGAGVNLKFWVSDLQKFPQYEGCKPYVSCFGSRSLFHSTPARYNGNIGYQEASY